MGERVKLVDSITLFNDSESSVDQYLSSELVCTKLNRLRKITGRREMNSYLPSISLGLMSTIIFTYNITFSYIDLNTWCTYEIVKSRSNVFGPIGKKIIFTHIY